MNAKEVGADLPRGWAWAKIKDIAKLNYRDPSIASLPDNLMVTFLPMAGVDAEQGKISKPEKRLLKQVRKGFIPFSEGDVLFAKITPSMENGKAAIAYDLINGMGFGSTEFHVIKPYGGVQSKWLFYFIRQERFRHDAKASFVGTSGQLRVPPDFIKECFIPIAPSQEQKRVIAKIEEYFSHLNAGITILQSAKIQLRHYRQSVLKAAIEGRLTRDWRKAHPEIESASDLVKRILSLRNDQKQLDSNYDVCEEELNFSSLPEGWIWIRLGRLFEVFVGATPKRNKPEYWGGTIPWVSSGEVAFCRIYKTHETISELGLLNSSTKIHPPGTVLLGIVGEGKTRGQAAILEISASNNQNSAAIRVSEVGLPPEYLYYYFEHEYKHTRKLGSGNNQPALNKNHVKSICLPLPPLLEQQKIIEEIERHIYIIERIDKAINECMQCASLIRQSILKRAFEGKLIPQNPNDESAAMLLARILEQKAGETKKPKLLKRPNLKEQIMPKKRFGLYEILSQAGIELTPQDLFYKAGFNTGTIEEFYQELREESRRSRIIEIRPNDTDVYLKVGRNEDK